MFDLLFHMLARDFGNYLMVLAALAFPSAIFTGVFAVVGVREKDIENKKTCRGLMWFSLAACIFFTYIAFLWKSNGGDVR